MINDLQWNESVKKCDSAQTKCSRNWNLMVLCHQLGNRH